MPEIGDDVKAEINGGRSKQEVTFLHRSERVPIGVVSVGLDTDARDVLLVPERIRQLKIALKSSLQKNFVEWDPMQPKRTAVYS